MEELINKSLELALDGGELIKDPDVWIIQHWVTENLCIYVFLNKDAELLVEYYEEQVLHAIYHLEDETDGHELIRYSPGEDWEELIYVRSGALSKLATREVH